MLKQHAPEERGFVHNNGVLPCNSTSTLCDAGEMLAAPHRYERPNTVMKMSPQTVLAVFMVALAAGSVEAANYYVATSGLDSNVGTLASPFQTIQKAANIAGSGDNVYVKGGTYRETVTVANSGTASAPITFQPYNNQRVTITGLDTLGSGWTNYGGSIYSQTVSSAVGQVFVDGSPMTLARWPNPVYNNPLRAVYATVDSASNQSAPVSSTITSSALGNPTNGTWNGAKMAIVPGYSYVTFSAAIEDQTDNTLSYQAPWSNQFGYNPRAGSRYYLYNSLNAMSASKQWYYDDASQTVYLETQGGVNPNGQDVEIRTRPYGFLATGSYVNISGFQLKAARVQTLGDNNVIDRCQILYPDVYEDPEGWNTPWGGVLLMGQNNTLRNSEVAYCWGEGVKLHGPYNTADNNIVHDVNWGGTDANFINAGNNSTIVNNTMYNAGRSGVLHRHAANVTITHNDISRFGFITKDLGGTYCYDTDGGGTVIAYNRIHDTKSSGISAGVYLDDGSSNFTVHHNLVYDVQRGVNANRPSTNNDIYNNTLWDVDYATIAHQTGDLTNINTYNNLSNKSDWVGTSLGNNISTTSDQFVDSAVGDYTLKPSSMAVDAGVVIPGITDGYTGSAPDAGAFESGVAPWSAGANWKVWLFGNQRAAPLESAVTVNSYGGLQDTENVLVGRATGGFANNRAYLKFDTSAISNVSNVKAILRVYECDMPDSSTGGVAVSKVTSDWFWDNTTHTGNVDYGESVSDTVYGWYDPDNLDMYTDIDISSIVQSWLDDPSSNKGLCLLSTAEGTAGSLKYFDNFYGVTAPQLIITVPEPSVLSLLASAVLAGFAVLICRKRR